jgi:hypothetical protein
MAVARRLKRGTGALNTGKKPIDSQPLSAIRAG